MCVKGRQYAMLCRSTDCCLFYEAVVSWCTVILEQESQIRISQSCGLSQGSNWDCSIQMVVKQHTMAQSWSLLSPAREIYPQLSCMVSEKKKSTSPTRITPRHSIKAGSHSYATLCILVNKDLNLQYRILLACIACRTWAITLSLGRLHSRNLHFVFASIFLWMVITSSCRQDFCSSSSRSKSFCIPLLLLPIPLHFQ